MRLFPKYNLIILVVGLMTMGAAFDHIIEYPSDRDDVIVTLSMIILGCFYSYIIQELSSRTIIFQSKYDAEKLRAFSKSNLVKQLQYKVLHTKRGTIYQVLGEGLLQSPSDYALRDYDTMIIYDDGKNTWVRHDLEFTDGRFEILQKDDS